MCNIVTEFYLHSIVYIYLINSRLDVTTSVRHHFRTRTLSILTAIKLSLFFILSLALLKALNVGRIRPFDRAAADLSPWSSCIWLQPRLTVEATHWLINYMLSLRDYFYVFEFESSSTIILGVTPRLTTHSFVTSHHCNKEFQL